MDADLVVIGSSRHAPTGTVATERTAGRPLHGAPCAVAIPPAGARENGPIRHTADALAAVRVKRRTDGGWRAEGTRWRPPGRDGSEVQVVDWGRRGLNEVVTLNALRVLAAAARRQATPSSSVPTR
jgi:hypothetical protein